jgi:hypothetical protein
MKADEDVRMVEDEAPVILAKTCEMFMLELTMHSWNHGKTRTLQKNNIATTVSNIVPHKKKLNIILMYFKL